VVGKEWNFQILVNLSVNNIQRCTGNIAKTFGLKNPLLPSTCIIAGGVPPDGAHVVHCRTEELLIQQDTSSVGKNTPPD
jgi:hypothetical protein